ncbi:hypothetical protein SKAU_G00332930 [Synaphobranchus kaupii]|uniref:Uncharacterized protein n=1 Tax=Synaphobranchus kaupii TaxID=118154 RepID=A0A9Q1ELN5_SYNKA|nr:hypothetical protein SKAU_G00332930 [Synaphobranchus kaupii]
MVGPSPAGSLAVPSSGLRRSWSQRQLVPLPLADRRSVSVSGTHVVEQRESMATRRADVPFGGSLRVTLSRSSLPGLQPLRLSLAPVGSCHRGPAAEPGP